MSSLFNIPEPVVNHHQQWAIGILQYGEQFAEWLVEKFRAQKEMFWNRDQLNGQPITIADAQKVIDEMGDNAVIAFTKHAALGQFIKSQYPGRLTDEELAAPVAYTIVDGKIILDANGIYPGPKNL